MRSSCRCDDVILGVRPEHLLPWSGDSNLLGPLEGAVEYVEALGRETFLGVRQDAETRLVVCVQGRAAVQPGDRMAYGVVPGGRPVLRSGDRAGARACERSHTLSGSPGTLATA